MTGCAHNTIDTTGDGKLWLMLDLDPDRANGQTIRVHVEVEGLDPIDLKFWGQERPPQRVNVSDAENWREWQHRLYDLAQSQTDERLPGGSEVRFRVDSDKYDTNEISFRMDGNTIVRLVPTDRSRPGVQHILIELAVQQSTY